MPSAAAYLARSCDVVRRLHHALVTSRAPPRHVARAVTTFARAILHGDDDAAIKDAAGEPIDAKSSPRHRALRAMLSLLAIGAHLIVNVRGQRDRQDKEWQPLFYAFNTLLLGEWFGLETHARDTEIWARTANDANDCRYARRIVVRLARRLAALVRASRAHDDGDAAARDRDDNAEAAKEERHIGAVVVRMLLEPAPPPGPRSDGSFDPPPRSY